jgi:hypothetical protein
MGKDRDLHNLQGSDTIIDVGGYWLRHYAGDFLAAAKAFKPPGTRFSPVPYYLVCHSIELSLKSFLYSAGINRRDRKKLNHDLEEALRAAEDSGLSAYLEITSSDREVLSKANRLYPKKEFEYFESLETVYDSHDFELDALTSFALRLFEAIDSPVMASTIR